MHGAFFFASSNRSRTRDAPTPTNISTKSDPVREKNGTFASPATAFARSVFPVPGGPTRRAPFGSFAPISAYRSGCSRKSTASCRDSLASSSPATSLKVTPVSFCMYILARLLPTPIMPVLLFILRSRTPIRTQIRTSGANERSTFRIRLVVLSGISSLNSTPAFCSRSTSLSSSMRPV